MRYLHFFTPVLLYAMFAMLTGCDKDSSTSEVKDLKRSAPIFGRNEILFQTFDQNGQSVVVYQKCKHDVETSRTCGGTKPLLRKDMPAASYFAAIRGPRVSEEKIRFIADHLKSPDKNLIYSEFQVPADWVLAVNPFVAQPPSDDGSPSPPPGGEGPKVECIFTCRCVATVACRFSRRILSRKNCNPAQVDLSGKFANSQAATRGVYDRCGRESSSSFELSNDCRDDGMALWKHTFSYVPATLNCVRQRD